MVNVMECGEWREPLFKAVKLDKTCGTKEKEWEAMGDNIRGLYSIMTVSHINKIQFTIWLTF